jgi:2-polyprenyl-6-methoxyphenol hydroxylase-like FAD-dependent oxidoreductase
MAGGYHARSRGRVSDHACTFPLRLLKSGPGLKIYPQYNDLLESLYNAAVAAGATITFGASVEEVQFDEGKNRPVVVLSDGTTLSADVVIGADGHRSIVRKFVAPEVGPGFETSHSFYT